jgi:eukaryotic-like serine/threonine-protein kinase
MNSCPSDATLARVGHDSLDGAEWTAVEAHVQHCEKCVGLLEKRLSHDTATAPASLPAEENLPHIPGFEIEGELGRGGMGVVYRAWEPKLARTVALKIVPSGPLTGSRERKRWLSEARCVTRVCHPNIVQIHDAGEADGWLYLVLEFVPGGSLKERLQGPVPPRSAAELMRPVATAMTAVHTGGLLHLDLKPSNILLDSARDATWKDVCPKVADFGIARPLADLDASSMSLAGPWGTPSYMAPEQIAADRAVLGSATDVYALGAILYELLTGRPPFLAASPIETFDQIRDAEPASPRKLNPSVPRDMDTICLRCLHKDTRKRYRSAEALADDLSRFLDGRPITARPVSPIEHAWRWCRRQPVIAALAATLLLTLIGSFVGLLTLLRHSEANYQVASRSLDELLMLLLKEEYFGSIIYTKSEYLKTLEIARTQGIELSKRYPLDIGGLRRLSMISYHLANFYARGVKPDEARSLLEECIGYCEAYLALSPGDGEVQKRRVEAASMMVYYLADSNDDQLYEKWNERTISMLEGLKSAHEVHVGEMFQLSHRHRRRADYLMLRGEPDRARRELEADLDLVRSVPIAETAFPEVALSETLTLAALGQRSGELRPLRSPIHWQPVVVDKDRPSGLRYFAELTARRIGWLPSIAKSPWLIAADLPTEAWTDRVISSIKADATKFGLDHTQIPALSWNMREYFASTLSLQKRVDKLDDARRFVDQLLALARRLTQSYPAHAAAYMLLSDGYVQRAKIAYQVDGEPVIEWEQKALDAAIHAATLEPENDEARGLVKSRRARVDKLVSKQ